MRMRMVLLWMRMVSMLLFLFYYYHWIFVVIEYVIFCWSLYLACSSVDFCLPYFVCHYFCFSGRIILILLLSLWPLLLVLLWIELPLSLLLLLLLSVCIIIVAITILYFQECEYKLMSSPYIYIFPPLVKDEAFLHFTLLLLLWLPLVLCLCGRMYVSKLCNAL